VSGLRVFAWRCALSRAGGGGGASGPGVLFVTMGCWYFGCFSFVGLRDQSAGVGPHVGLHVGCVVLGGGLGGGFSFVWGSGSRV